MRIFSRIGMIGTVSMGIIVTSDATWARQPTQSLHALQAPSGDRAFYPKDAAGHYLAIHFLTPADTSDAASFVRDFLQQAPTLAGVRHVFVKPDDAAAVKAWAAQFGDSADAIFVDPGGTLAMDLHVPYATPAAGAPPRTPATIVFGPGGEELLRYVGRTPDDYLAFGDFARLLTEKSTQPALADYNLPTGKTLAVEGYDVVAYFTKSKAVIGRAAISSTYRGVKYQFDTETNRALFSADPERYLPTYGGWCASAMGAKGTKVEIDPTNFKIKDGRLFLFYKSLLGDALRDWNQHEREWEPAADRNWKKLTGEEPTAFVK